MTKDVDSLMKQAFDCLESLDTKQAIRIGKKLKSLRHSSAFEILALAYAQDDKRKKAINILREGLKKVPQIWILWQLLGNYLSDEEDYESAFHAYENALKCPDVRRYSVFLNFAVALKRARKFNEAFEYLAKIEPTDDAVYLQSRLFHLELLNATGEHQQVIESGDELLKTFSNDETHAELLPSLFEQIGSAHWFSEKKSEPALTYAWKSIALNKHSGEASWLIREIENRYSPNSRYFRVLVEGTWHESFEGESFIRGFYTNYDVVAETPEEALEFTEKFEPEAVRDSLKISEYQMLEKSPDQPKGVYKCASYIFFEPEQME